MISSDSSTVDTPIEFDQVSISKSEPIVSLDVIDAELVVALGNREDPQRLDKAKRIIERYQGVDWVRYRKLNDPDGSPLTAYDRARVARHENLFELLILSWAPGAQSKIHDHPCERCFLTGISGNMFEERYIKEADGALRRIHKASIPNGVPTWISDDIGLHSVGNDGDEIACSLHCYVPGFTRAWNLYDPKTGEYCGTSGILLTQST